MLYTDFKFICLSSLFCPLRLPPLELTSPLYKIKSLYQLF